MTGVILAGIGNSGPLHWQTQWQQAWPAHFSKVGPAGQAFARDLGLNPGW